MYKKKEDFRRAKMQYPNIDNLMEKWECDEGFQRTCLDFQVTPRKMTNEGFINAEAQLLNQLPEEFRSYASSEAYDHGHSAGYEEIIGYLRGIVNGLREPIEKYKKRVIDSNH
ncbi:MAG: hypothetical protein WCH76_07180 [Candidatus Riflemargulisbacteria bacterium]